MVAQPVQVARHIFRLNSRLACICAAGCLLQGQPADPEALAQHVAACSGASAGVLLDCTASDSLPQHYTHWLGDLGLHIITPNKQLGSGPLQRYQHLRQLQHTTGQRTPAAVASCMSCCGGRCM